VASVPLPFEKLVALGEGVAVPHVIDPVSYHNDYDRKDFYNRINYNATDGKNSVVITITLALGFMSGTSRVETYCWGTDEAPAASAIRIQWDGSRR
jgi:hypothetical protein